MYKDNVFLVGRGAGRWERRGERGWVYFFINNFVI